MLVARALTPVVFMAQLYSIRPLLVRANLGPVQSRSFGTRLAKVSWRPQCERISSQVVMPHEGRRSILCLMSVIEGRLPAQQCVIVLEHPAPARHSALCRYAARFALFAESTAA